MASLLKNQVIKHLSKFVKNLSSNQINLSAIKGEGELSSIILDERALEDVTSLPTWLKIRKATCGRLFIKIPWTNLKTTPIQLHLDDVTVEIETLKDLRDPNVPSSANNSLKDNYSFIDRVIDGISIAVTNVTLLVTSQGFKATAFVPTLDIYSTTPHGKRVDTLTYTRLRNVSQGYILLFKEICWPSARIEVSSNDQNGPVTSTRFIVNSCRMRISMKKNLDDGSMISGRVIIQFDDLLLVLNDAQLKSVLTTYKEITELMARASEQRKQHAGENLVKSYQQQKSSKFQLKPQRTGSTDLVTPEQEANDPFVRYDIIETSLHFNVKRLDLHIMADSDTLVDRFVENGTFQITIANLSIDFYPYHQFGSTKKHWLNYDESQSVAHSEWITRLYKEWYEEFNSAKESAPIDDRSMKFERALQANKICLFESCTVISIDDFVLYPVSLSNDKQQKRRQPLISSDKTCNSLPDNLSIVKIHYSEYYYPAPYSFPVPNSNLYIGIMPLLIRIDLASLSWFDALTSTLSLTLDDSGVISSETSTNDFEHIAIRMEIILPRVFVRSDIFTKTQPVRNQASGTSQSSEVINHQQYEILEISISRILFTNTRVEPTSDREELTKHLELLKKTSFIDEIQSSSTKRLSPSFMKCSHETYLYKNPLNKYATNLPQAKLNSKSPYTYYTMATDSLKKSAKCDIWHLNVSNVYLDFTPSSPSHMVKYSKQNMTETLSMTSWLVLENNGESYWLNGLCVLENPCILKLSQKQFTFIMRFADELGRFLDVLARNKDQMSLIREKLSIKDSSVDINMTIYLAIPTTLTLAVIDHFQDPIIPLLTPTQSILSEQQETEAVIPNTSDIETDIQMVTSNLAGSMTLDKPIINKNLDLSGQKKSKIGASVQRGFEIISKFKHSGSVSSSLNTSENSDESSSQWDINEEFDSCLDASFLNTSFEEQYRKSARIELDDDSIELTENNYFGLKKSELVDGVFIKLNQINLCIKEDHEQSGKPMLILCNCKYLRIDEFFSLEYDELKPKLFKNENPDMFNNETVPTIDIRIDFPKGEPSPPPSITVYLKDRILTIPSHAIDVLSQNLQETDDTVETNQSNNVSSKLVPINAQLNNVQIILQPPQELSSVEPIAEKKPLVEAMIEYIDVQRQMDGKVIIRKTNNNDDEKSKQFELLRQENERLRSELNTYKAEVSTLRSERDSLNFIISNLGIEFIATQSKSST